MICSPWRRLAAYIGENLALRISFTFVIPKLPTFSGGRRGSTGCHAKFLARGGLSSSTNWRCWYNSAQVVLRLKAVAESH
jgi:hypothetical protein